MDDELLGLFSDGLAGGALQRPPGDGAAPSFFDGLQLPPHWDMPFPVAPAPWVPVYGAAPAADTSAADAEAIVDADEAARQWQCARVLLPMCLQFAQALAGVAQVRVGDKRLRQGLGTVDQVFAYGLGRLSGLL